ncbi:MAG: PAS domain-containing protein [Betaproteobacteria bacterium]|nr:PAS domain-containing protein [Betaproteobacteria bacterium]
MEPKRSPTAVPDRRRAPQAFPARSNTESARILPLRPMPYIEPVAFDVDENGLVLDCSASAQRVLGYCGEELSGRHVSLFLPRLGQTPLVQDGAVNPRLAFLCHCGVPFRACARDGAAFACDMSLNMLGNDARSVVRIIVRRVEQPVPHCL